MAEVKQTMTVEKPVTAINVRLTSAAAFSQGNQQDLRAALATAFQDTVSISVYYKTKEGKTLYPYTNFDLQAIVEHAQFQEGVVSIVRTGVSGSYVYTMHALVPLTKEGSIQFSNDETMTIEVITDDAKFTAIAFDVVESPVASPTWTKFDRLSIEEGKKEKTFDITDVETIMIPLDALTDDTDLILYYTNGQNVIQKQALLEIIGRQVNDCCYDANGISVSGFGRYAILPAGTINRIDVRRAATTAFDIITVMDEPIGDVQKVAEINESLKDNAHAELESKMQAHILNHPAARKFTQMGARIRR